MKEQLLTAWRINNEKNLLVIDETSAEGMQKTLSVRGGRNVYQQFIHIHNTRLKWLEISAKELYTPVHFFTKDATFEKNFLRQALLHSAEGIEKLINTSWENNGKVKSFKNGLIPMIAYFISHESHHRGNILLTLKQNGIQLNDSLKWSLWEWDK